MSVSAHLDWYKSRSCALIPLAPGTKHAAKGWQTLSYSPAQLEGHLARGGSLAWRLGENDLVIDADLYRSKTAGPFARLNEHFGGHLPVIAPTVQTARGGRHYYFKVPADVHLKTVTEVYGPHIEFKSHGTYVTVPPSPGYSFDGASPLNGYIPQAPLWLVNHLTVKTPDDMPDSPHWPDQTLDAVLGTLPVAEYGSHSKWWPILCSSHYATNGLGLESFLSWSMGDPTYSGDSGLIRLRWESLTTSAKPNYITHLSLIKEIKNRYGYLPEQAQAALDVKDFIPVSVSVPTSASVSVSVPTSASVSERVPSPPADEGTLKVYEDLDLRIKRLSPTSSTASIMACIESIARLDAIQQSRLIPLLAKTSGMSRTDVKKYVTQASKQRYAARADLGARERVQGEQGEQQNPVPADLGHYLAELVLHEYYADGKHLIYAPEGQYWEYTGTHWQTRSDEQVDNSILMAAMQLRNDLSAAASVTVSQLISQARMITRSISAGAQSGVLDRTNPKSVINCTNGELWVDRNTGATELRRHSPSSGLCACLSIEYDPAATAPLWDHALYGMFAPLVAPWEVSAHLHEIIGYTLQPEKNLAAWVLLYGRGNNGKSTVIDVLSAMLGEDSVISVGLNDFSKQPHIYAAVASKLAVIEDDLKKGGHLPDDVLKKLSESKIISANPKQRDYFSFRNVSTVWAASNHWPKTTDMSEGMRRRPYVFEFKRDFTKDGTVDHNLKQKIIRHELPGVLNNSLAGLVRLRARGTFERPYDCERVRDAWLDNTNQVKRFFVDRTERVEGMRTPLSSLYQNYCVWCEAEGISLRLRKTRSGVEHELVSMGESVRLVNRAKSVLDVSLKSEW